MSDLNREPTDDERLGMLWWNGLAVWERGDALRAATTKDNPVPSPADAWATWRVRGLVAIENNDMKERQ